MTKDDEKRMTKASALEIFIVAEFRIGAVSRPKVGLGKYLAVLEGLSRE